MSTLSVHSVHDLVSSGASQISSNVLQLQKFCQKGRASLVALQPSGMLQSNSPCPALGSNAPVCMCTRTRKLEVCKVEGLPCVTPTLGKQVGLPQV